MAQCSAYCPVWVTCTEVPLCSCQLTVIAVDPLPALPLPTLFVMVQSYVYTRDGLPALQAIVWPSTVTKKPKTTTAGNGTTTRHAVGDQLLHNLAGMS